MRSHGKTLHLFLFSLISHALLTLAWGAGSNPVFHVEEITGQATWTLSGQAPVAMTRAAALPLGKGTLVTGPGSRTRLRLPNAVTISLGPESEVELLDLQRPASPAVDADDDDAPPFNTEFNIRRGELTSHVRKLRTGSTYKINTPLGVAGVRGTTFRVTTTEILQSSVAGVEGLIETNWVRFVSVSTADGLVDFSLPSGRRQDVRAGNALVTGTPVDHPAEAAPDLFYMRTLHPDEIDAIRRDVNALPPKPPRYIGGGGPRSPYNLKPIDERLR